MKLRTLVFASLGVSLVAAAIFWLGFPSPAPPDPGSPAPVPTREASVPEEALPEANPNAPVDEGAPERAMRDPLEAPFLVQAPRAQWDNIIFENACEEASLIIVSEWLRGTSDLSAASAEEKILELVDYERQSLGFAIDTGASDVHALMMEYFGVDRAELREGIALSDLKSLLDGSHVAIAPMDGQALGNPFFTPPGPEHHMIVILRYDPATDEFITHDPGTRRGALYRYGADMLYAAIRDYPSGPTHGRFPSRKRSVILVPSDASIQEVVTSRSPRA